MVEMILTNGNNADGNPTLTPDSGSEQAQIASMYAEAKQGFKDMLAGKTPDATPTKPETVQPSVTPTEQPKNAVEQPKASEAGDKIEVPKQFQAKDGSLDENKILKSTQNQEALNAKKREMLEKYKALQREGSQIDKSLKEVKPVETASEPKQVEPDFTNFLSGQLSKDELEALETAKNEPVVRALLKAQAALAKVSTEDVRREIELSKAQSRDIALLERLDKLANSHDWLYTDEGKARLEEVFKQDPGLWKTQDPYGYAVGRLAQDMPSQGKQNGQARPEGTPMLGAGHALPPSQAEPVSPSQELEIISQRVTENLDNRSELRKAENELRNKFRNIISKR